MTAPRSAVARAISGRWSITAKGRNIRPRLETMWSKTSIWDAEA